MVTEFRGGFMQELIELVDRVMYKHEFAKYVDETIAPIDELDSLAVKHGH